MNLSHVTGDGFGRPESPINTEELTRLQNAVIKVLGLRRGSEVYIAICDKHSLTSSVSAEDWVANMNAAINIWNEYPTSNEREIMKAYNLQS